MVDMVTVDLRSGRTIRVTEDILPARWWENTDRVIASIEKDSEGGPWKDLELLENYVPPAGSVYRNIWPYAGGPVRFEVVEPGGRLVLVEVW